MNYTHIAKLAAKFIARGFVFKAGKRAALKGGKTGIGIASLFAGGYLAFQLMQERKKQLKEERKLKKGDHQIAVE